MRIFQPIISGSLIESGSMTVSGSVTATQGFTGSLFGTSSWTQNFLTSSVTSASFASTSSLALNFFTSSVTSASFSSTASLALNFITSSVTSASFASTSSLALNFLTSSVTSASYAATASAASNFVVGNSITASSALITGTITAQTLVVQTITSSTDYVTGSTRFGSLLTNTHVFTGSVSITGSLEVIGRATISNLTGSLFGTSSWAQNFLTSSVTSASFSSTASLALNFITSSVTSASFASSASLAVSSSLSISSSFAVTAISSSFPITVTGSTLRSVSPAGGVGASVNNGIFLGNNAGSNASSANSSIFLGGNAGQNASSANDSIFLGGNAGQNASSALNSNFLGSNAGLSATNALGSNFLGQSAGRDTTNASNSNFLGQNAGRSATSASNSTLIGLSVGYNVAGGALGIRSNNIIIGTNITLPDGAQDSINLGSIIFATGSYSTITGNPFSGSVTTGRVGINKISPAYTLDVSGSGNYSDGLTVTGSFTVITGSSIELQVTNIGVRIGNLITDTHSVTGSLRISGSLTATSFTGSLFGTASLATTASYYQIVTGSIGTDVSVTASLSGSIFNIPDASATARGLITSQSQTIGGQKTFNRAIAVSDTTDSGGAGSGNFLITTIQSLATTTNPKYTGIFGASQTNVRLGFGGGNSAQGINNGSNYFGAIFSSVAPAVNTSGTGSLFAQMVVRPMTNAEGNPVTASATVYIESAANFVSTQNYALWIDSGSTRLDGDLIMSGSNILATGSISATQGFTGSLFGTASWAVSASWAPGGSSTITVADEGTSQGTATFLNFTGAGVTATVSANTASINIPGGAGAAFPFSGSAQITGSLGVTGSVSVTAGGFTGSLFGTSSLATTASYYQLVTGSAGSDFNIVATPSGSIINIPDATLSTRGLVNSTIQLFSGLKYFVNGINVGQSAGNFVLSMQSSPVDTTLSNLLFPKNSTNVSYGLATAITNTSTINPGNAYGTYIIGRQAIQEASSGDHPIISQLSLLSLNLINGSATTTNGATLYIEGPASGSATITNNYALWIDSGSARLDGDLIMSGSNIAATGSISATNGFTGSLFGTSSFALTASFALNAGGGSGAGFPYDGEALITGSIVLTSGSGFPSLLASETLTAGDYVNIFSGGVRRASSNDITKQAHGFVSASHVATNPVVVFYSGLNTNVTGLTAGARYFLSASGTESTIPPTATAQLSQEVGVAISSTALLVNFGPAIIT